MRVLVTGGAGYIGNLVIAELIERDHHPVVLDNLLWGTDAIAPYLDQIDLIEGDARSSRDVVYALEGADAVVHLAGIVGEPACKVNYQAHHTTNIEATRNVVACATDPGLPLVRDFIFLSSCSVYGNVAGMYDEVTEETPTSPLSLYAEGKLRSEQIIAERAAQVPHFHPTILRLTTVFGWSPRPRLDLVTNLFVHRALTEGRLTIFGDGQQYRSLIHVRDVANAVAHVLDTPRLMRDRRVFHVGEETNNKTVRQIAETVKEALPETQIDYLPGQDTDRRDYRISCQRIKNVANWKARYSVADGIRELVDEIRSRDWDWDSVSYRNNLYPYR